MMPGIHKCKAVYMYTRNLPIDKKSVPMKLSNVALKEHLAGSLSYH